MLWDHNGGYQHWDNDVLWSSLMVFDSGHCHHWSPVSIIVSDLHPQISEININQHRRLIQSKPVSLDIVWYVVNTWMLLMAIDGDNHGEHLDYILWYFQWILITSFRNSLMLNSYKRCTTFVVIVFVIEIESILVILILVWGSRVGNVRLGKVWGG